VRRLVNFCWSIFKWAFALLLVAALIVGGYLYVRLDEEIRCYAQSMLNDHYDQLQVDVGGARFVPGRGVTIFDVSFAPHQHPLTQSNSGPGPLLHLGELNLVGSFEIAQLIEGKSTVDRVVVRRPRLVATRLAAGGGSFDQLLPPPQFGDSAPPMEIVDATLVVIDETKPQAQPLVLRNANLVVTRQQTGPTPEDATLEIKGTVQGSLAQQIAIEGQLQTSTGAFTLTADINELRLDNQLLAAAPLPSQGVLSELDIQATVSAKATIRRSGHQQPFEWAGAFQVRSGMVNHPKMPRPLTGMHASGEFNTDELVIRDLRGKCGVAEITAACNRRGWGATAPVALRCRIADLPLDTELQSVLPARLKKHWRRFRPAGEVDATVSLTFDGARWQPDATFDFRNVSVEDAEKFPYRLTNSHGVMRFVAAAVDPNNHAAPAARSGAADIHASHQGRLELSLQGSAEGRAVAINAEFFGLPCPGDPPRRAAPGPKAPCPVGWVEINAPQLRVSEAMIAALAVQPKAHSIARALNPTGEFGARWRMHRKNAAQVRPDVEIDINAIKCGLNYNKFKYPLSQVRGVLRLRGGAWRFDNVESREANGPRVITASGSLTPVDGRQIFKMRLSAVAANLDEQLRTALPPQHQAVWQDLRPEGRVSFVTDVTYVAGDRQPRIDLVAVPHQRSVSIEPKFFRYRLDRLDGRFVLSEGSVTFTGARAEHGQSIATADGSWTPLAEGGWRFELEKLHVDYLDADHDLRLAAPLALRRAIDQLQPEGSFGLHDGRLAFTYNPRQPGELRTDFDIQLDCHQANVNLGVLVEGASGGIRLTGVKNGDDCRVYGELQLDTMFWNGLQLTNVRGPLWTDDAECRFGRGVAEKQPGAPPVAITASAYGGNVALNTRVLHGGDRLQYGMSIDYTDVDLDRLSRDYLNLETPIAGRVNGQLNLSGQGNSVYGLEGNGKVEVTDANLYQLPQMVALLKVLRNRTPTATAFDGCQAEFKMQGKHLQFSKLDLLGDAVSLYGRGEASLDKELNLIFHSIVGRNASAVPLLKTIVGQASEQLLRVRVGGTFDQPDIRREALPVVGSMFEQFRADIQPKPLSQPASNPQAAALRRR